MNPNGLRAIQLSRGRRPQRRRASTSRSGSQLEVERRDVEVDAAVGRPHARDATRVASTSAKAVERVDELDAEELGDRLVGDLPADGVDAERHRRVAPRRARPAPCTATSWMYGSVALVSAYVLVCGTAPGMLPTA